MSTPTAKPFKVGDRVHSARGMYVGEEGVVVRGSRQPGFVRVRLRRNKTVILKSIYNLEHAIPMYLRMDKGL